MIPLLPRLAQEALKRGLRPAGIGLGPRRPAKTVTIRHGDLLVVTALAWGTAKCAGGTRPLVTRLTLTLSRAGAKVTWRPAKGPATANRRIRHTGESLGGLPRTCCRSVHANRNLSRAPAASLRDRQVGNAEQDQGGPGCNLGCSPTPCRIVRRGPGRRAHVMKEASRLARRTRCG